MMIPHTDGPAAPIVYRPHRSGLDRGLTIGQTVALLAAVLAVVASFAVAPSPAAAALALAALVLVGVTLIPIQGRTLWAWAELRYSWWRRRGEGAAWDVAVSEWERRTGEPFGLIAAGGRLTVCLSVQSPLGAQPGSRWLTRRHCDVLAHAGATCGAATATVVIDPGSSSHSEQQVRVTYAFARRGAAVLGGLDRQAGEVERRLPAIIAGAASAGLDLTVLTAEQNSATIGAALRTPPHSGSGEHLAAELAEPHWDHVAHNGHRSITCESLGRGVGHFPDVLPHLRAGWEQARVALLYRFDGPAQRIVDENYRFALSRGVPGTSDEALIAAAVAARTAVARGAAVAQIRTLLTVTAPADQPLPETGGRALRCWYGQQEHAFTAALGLAHPVSAHGL
ncbi:hypothetical protein DFR67_12641 [Williamsia limnetica]|uniref:Uncharacterized protein n=1 Tax=Williamsia limnetica TaxID=882452 RepID=A0A318R8X3_WILLI|nr:hypothetical protein [Williamsia limnetica]PYE12033.1 hypothetical protein DFR67_12641 [Williamsia limnetica]